MFFHPLTFAGENAKAPADKYPLMSIFMASKEGQPNREGACIGTFAKVTPEGCEHTNVTTTTVEATCTTPGSVTVVCDDCGETISTETIDALGHDYDSVVTEPTCTEQGYTTHTCSVCGDTYVDAYVDALGHDYDAVVTEPDCVNGGYTTYTCKVCGYSYVGDETSTVDGFVTEEGKTYYYENGQKVTGWKEIAGSTYYFVVADGAMLKDTNALIGEQIYFFDAEGKLLETLEITIIDGKCYLHEKYQLFGWQEVNGVTYYFDAEGKLVVPAGYEVVDGMYYNAETTEKVSGWITINDKEFYIKAQYDVVLRNIKAIIGGEVYYFDADGAVIDTPTISNDKCFYGDIQEYGWQTIGGKEYYFDPSNDGLMVKDTYKYILNVRYQFDEDGAKVEQTFVLKGGKGYTLEGELLTKTWLESNGKTYYFNKSGYMMTGRASIGGVIYNFDSTGALIG